MAHYQRKDHFHQQAKADGYRSRAAYKLLEIQQAHRLLRSGQRVVDLGCWPGGWLQVAASAVGPSGRVVGVDVTPLENPFENENVIAIEADLAEVALSQRIHEILGGAADLLLCDAAPKLSGIRVADRAREGALLEAVEVLVAQLLRPGGDLLLKLLDCPEADAVARRLSRCFEQAKTLKPQATRPGSRERYLLGRRWIARAQTGRDARPQ